MKELIKEVTFHKEKDTQFGKMYSFKVKYDNKVAFYSSKKKEQTYFKPGEEAEFTEEEKTYESNGETKSFLVIKPVARGKQSYYGKELKKEQSKYSGFAVSYAKDLVIAGKLELKNLPEYSTVLFDLMVSLDKSIE